MSLDASPGIGAPNTGDGGFGRDEPSIVAGIGGSAGSIEVTAAVLAALPEDFQGAVVVVIHLGPGHPSALAAVLGRAGPLRVIAPVEPAPLAAGAVYVASPGLHLVVGRGWVAPVPGPRENGHRPAVDPLFRTLAEVYGPRAVGVVVSGARDDGTAGLHAIKRHGGKAYAQDPVEALFDGMPASAARHVALDGVLRVHDIAARLTALAATTASDQPRPTHAKVMPPNPYIPPEREDDATRFTCPDCGGVMFHHAQGDLLQYRCSVGHAYSPDSFAAEHARVVETALWEGARIMSDRAALMDDMRRRAERLEQPHTARRFAERGAEAERHADALRGLVEWIAADVQRGGAEPATAD